MIAEDFDFDELRSLDERSNEELEEILKKHAENGHKPTIDLAEYERRQERHLTEQRQQGMAWYQRAAEALGPLIGHTPQRRFGRIVTNLEGLHEQFHERYENLRGQLTERHQELREAGLAEIAQQHRFDAGQELYLRVKKDVEEAEAEVEGLPKSRATVALYEAQERLTDLRQQLVDIEVQTIDAEQSFKESLREKTYLEEEAASLRREVTIFNIQRNAVKRGIHRAQRIQQREFGRDGQPATNQLYKDAGKLLQSMEGLAQQYLGTPRQALDPTYLATDEDFSDHPSIRKWERIRST